MDFVLLKKGSFDSDLFGITKFFNFLQSYKIRNTYVFLRRIFDNIEVKRLFYEFIMKYCNKWLRK